MQADFIFFINSIMLGFALAMDAFSVSVTNGIAYPDLRFPRRCLVAGTYAFFQFIMPVAGWICVNTIIEYFRSWMRFRPKKYRPPRLQMILATVY